MLKYNLTKRIRALQIAIISITKKRRCKMTGKDRYRRSYPVSWDQLHKDSKALAWRLIDTGQRWDKIIAVVRGGLVPAAIIARELDIHYVDTVCVSSYTLKEQGELKIIKSIEGLNGENALIIDDLVDTGKTARIVRQMLPHAHFATVYAKPDGRPYVDTYVTEVSQDTWILFPWDSEIQFIEPLIQQKP